MSKDAKINFRDAPISLDLGSLYIHSKPNITGYVRLYGHCNSVVVCLSVVSACLNVVKLLHLTIIRGLNFQAIFMPYRLVGGIMFFCLAACLSIRQSIRSFVTNLMNTMFYFAANCRMWSTGQGRKEMEVRRWTLFWHRIF